MAAAGVTGVRAGSGEGCTTTKTCAQHCGQGKLSRHTNALSDVSGKTNRVVPFEPFTFVARTRTTQHTHQGMVPDVALR